MRKKQIITLLISIVLLGLFLRFYNLGKESLWLDEGATTLAVKYHGPFETLKIFYNVGQILPEFYTNNPDLPTGNSDLPVYYFLLSVWVRAFSLNEFTLRALSAIFGSVSIIITFLLAKEFFNEKVAILSSLLVSLNLTLIEYSQEARAYSLLLLLVLLSAYSLIKYVKSKKNIFLFYFIIFNLLGVYTHYVFAYFVLFEAVFIYIANLEAIKGRKFKLDKLQISFLIVLLSYAPLMKRIFMQKLVTIAYTGKPADRKSTRLNSSH